MLSTRIYFIAINMNLTFPKIVFFMFLLMSQGLDLMANPSLLDLPEPPPLDKSVATDFKLDQDEKSLRRLKQQPLGFGQTYGKALPGKKDSVPWYINRVWDGTFPGDALLVGDVLLAINGKATDKNAKRQFEMAQKQGHRDGYFWLTRWREGKIKRCFVDMGNRAFDLTQTQVPAATRDWKLGPLGVNGWCFHRRTQDGASRESRQIIITAVDKNGPSYGKLQEKDVILGVNGKNFSWDARRALASAINEAEKETNKGQLKLKVWRNKKSIETQINLPAMGTFSETAPFNCPKTDKIVDNAVEYIKANADTLLKFTNEKHIGWINYITGLGLMATGRDDVMPLVRKLAHETILPEGEKLNIDHHVSMMCWWWSYRTLFLCEYYLLTQDKAVLPTIEEYATKLAMGQSGAGTWGHTYAAKANTGYLHGHLGGYGAINQQGLTVMIALPLAVKCGIKNKEVLDAIQRGKDFFSFFIDKGTIPYGDHGPSFRSYDDNVKSGSAAVLFDLLGNSRGTEFFSEMVLGSAPSGKEEGHTGHFWAHLWGGIGVARGGDASLQAYMKEMRPGFTLERQHDGNFVFQDNPGENGLTRDPKERYNCTGARLLQLCYPKRKLFITGKKTPQTSHLKKGRVEEIFKAGRLLADHEARSKLSQDEILTLLRAPLPPTRSIGVKALSEQKLNMVEELIKMLDSDHSHARYGATEALRKCGFASQAAAEKLIQLAKSSNDLTFLTYAVNAFTAKDKNLGLLGVAKPAIPVFMNIALKDFPSDPRGVLRNSIGEALFYAGRAQPARGLVAEHGLDEKHRPLLIPLVKKLLANENGRVRGITAKWVYPILTTEERDQLWGDIYKATRYIAPSGIMFASGVRLNGLTLMAENNISEGLNLAVWYLRYQKGHGSSSRVPSAIKSIEAYGSLAKEFIPELKSHIKYWEATERRRHTLKDRKHPANLTRKLIEKLEKLPDEPKKELISIGKHLKPLKLEFPPQPIRID